MADTPTHRHQHTETNTQTRTYRHEHPATKTQTRTHEQTNIQPPTHTGCDCRCVPVCALLHVPLRTHCHTAIRTADYCEHILANTPPRQYRESLGARGEGREGRGERGGAREEGREGGSTHCGGPVRGGGSASELSESLVDRPTSCAPGHRAGEAAGKEGGSECAV